MIENLGEGGTCSREFLAKFCGITTKWTTELQKEDVMVKKGSTYDFFASVSNFIQYQKDQAAGGSDKQDLTKQKLEQEIRKLVRDNDRDDGILGNRREMIRAGQPIITRLSNDLDRIGELAAEVEPLDPKTIEEINLYFISYKNELADLADKLLTPDAR